MTIQWNEDKQDWEFDGLTLDEEANYQDHLDESSLIEAGLLDEAETKQVEDAYTESNEQLEKKHKNPLSKLDNFMGYVSPRDDKTYEKLNTIDTAVDIVKAVGTEALHIIQPKPIETQYEARTHFAENMKYLYRYGIGFVGVGKFGAALKGVQSVSKIGKFAKGAGKVLSADYKILEVGANASKAEKAIKGAAKIGSAGIVDGFVADFIVGRPDEGEGLLGDMLPDSNNPIIKYFQTDVMDSGLEWKFKNALQGSIIGIGLNFTLHGLAKTVDVVAKQYKALKNVANAVNSEEATQAVKDFQAAEEQTENILKGQELIDNVAKVYDEAVKNNDIDIERTLLNQDFVNKGNESDALDILSKLQKGHEVTPNTDGSFSITVTKWQDAAEVSLDELKTQTKNDGISLMDDTVRDVWKERKLLASDEEIININEKTGKITVNKDAVKRVLDYYRNKFKIDNKIEIHFVDGKLDGEDATTEALEYIGKTVKNKQNSIDKKKLQIKDLEDKITMLEGGNKEVSDPLNVLQEKLKIAKNELKDLEKPTKISNIKISINKNAPDIYATLRSELEHARDIAKGTTPKNANVKGSGVHFSRYNGDNESEASLEYIKHKADNRAGITSSQEVKSPITEETIQKPSTSQAFDDFTKPNSDLIIQKIGNIIDNNILEELGIKDVAKDIPVLKMTEEEIKAAKTDKTIEASSLFLTTDDKIKHIKVNPEFSPEEIKKSLYHELIHVKQLQDPTLRKQYLDLIRVTKQVDNIETLDKNIENYFNHPLEQEAENIAEKYIKQEQEFNVRGNEQSGNIRLSKNNVQPESTSGENGLAGSRDVSLDRRASGSDGINTTQEKAAAEQRAIEKVENINKQLDKAAKDTVIPFKVQLENAQEIYNKLNEYGRDNLAGIKEAVSKGDVDYVNMVVAKQLATLRRNSDLQSELKTLPETATQRIDEILEEINIADSIVKELASAYGRGFGAQKLVKSTRNIFSLSSMEELGLDNMAELLSVDITKLNFTRGLPNAKAELYEKIAQYHNGEILRQIQADSSTAEAFDNYIEQLLKNKTTDVNDIKTVLRDFAAPIKRRDALNLLKQAPEPERTPKILKSIKANGGIESYVVHNLLSNVGTTVANVVSGVINTVYFPMTKMLGGLIGADKTLFKEGAYQLKGLLDTASESLLLAKEAFYSGEGKLINLGKRVPSEADTDKYIGFNKAFNLLGQGESFKETLQNVHSLMTRYMGASDEFLTQMNYRAITRAKYLIQAEELAAKVGRSGDNKWIQEQAQKNFNAAFTVEGKPLDVKAIAEARDIVYQTPLSGKYWDYSTNSYTQVKEQTLLMGYANTLTQAAVAHPSLKLLFPFIRTPVNIAQMALEHNPIYAVCSPAQRKLIFSNTPEGNIAKAKVCFGTLSTMIGYGFAAQGFITGAPPIDNKERAALFKTGWRPYSFKVGDKYYSYSKIEPLCTIFGFSADMHSLLNSYNPDDELAENIGRFTDEAFAAIIGTTLDKTSFMNGLEQFSNIYKIIRNQDNIPVEKIAQSLQMFLPDNAAIQALSTFGEREDTKPQGFYQTLRNKYFNRGLGDYKRNIWGERQTVYNYLISSGAKGLDENSLEDVEIMRLAELGWKPTELTNNEYGTGIKYKDFKNPETGRTFYDAMLEEMTTIMLDDKTLREAVREEIESEDYQRAVDGIDPRYANDKDTKKNRIATIFNDYKKAARNKVIDEQGDDFFNKAGLTATEQREQDREEIAQKKLQTSLEQTLQNIRSFG